MKWLCWFWHRWREMGTKRSCMRCGAVEYLRYDPCGFQAWSRERETQPEVAALQNVPPRGVISRPVEAVGLIGYPGLVYRRCTPGEEAENGCELAARFVWTEEERRALGPWWHDSAQAARAAR